jgi:Ni,Fe-hydrogenase I small subunit
MHLNHERAVEVPPVEAVVVVVVVVVDLTFDRPSRHLIDRPLAAVNRPPRVAAAAFSTRNSAPCEMKAQHNSNIFTLAWDNENEKIFSGANDHQVIVHDVRT